MYETLQDISLICCTSMLCVGIGGFLVLSSLLRRAGRGFGDVVKPQAGLAGLIDVDMIGNLLGGRR